MGLVSAASLLRLPKNVHSPSLAQLFRKSVFVGATVNWHVARRSERVSGTLVFLQE